MVHQWDAGKPVTANVPERLMPLRQIILRGDKPKGGKRPKYGDADEALLEVALKMKELFGCTRYSGEALGALAAVTGYTEDAIRKKLLAAGKGTSKQSERTKVKRRKT